MIMINFVILRLFFSYFKRAQKVSQGTLIVFSKGFKGAILAQNNISRPFAPLETHK